MKICIWLGIYVLLFCDYLLVNETKRTSAGLTAACAVCFVLLCRMLLGGNSFDPLRGTAAGISAAAAVLGVWYLRKEKYRVYLGQSILILGLLCIGAAGVWKALGKSTAGKIAAGICGIILLLPLLFLAWTAICPNTLVKGMQQKLFRVRNSRTAVPEKKMLDGGHTWYSNIEYGAEYPNSFLDIYVSAAKSGQKRGMLFYIHGGGYVWGDKAAGDPNASDGALGEYFRAFLKQGYDVVSVNYAFAPEYIYPTPVRQLSQALQFVTEHAGEYALAADAVILAGSSAGGQLAGQLANLQTNPAYSQKTGIAPVLAPHQLKAVVFNSALLDNEEYSVTGDVLYDYLFFQLGRVYFDCGFLKGNSDVIESNVIENIVPGFPPCYISDGNTATFYRQARKLEERLTKLSVMHEFHFHEKTEVTLTHGYETAHSEWAKENMRCELEFLRLMV